MSESERSTGRERAGDDATARRAVDDAADRAARAETLRRDGARTLGENLEQAHALIRVAYELAGGLSSARS